MAQSPEGAIKRCHSGIGAASNPLICIKNDRHTVSQIMTEESIAEKGGAKADWGNLASLLYQFAVFKRNDKLRCGEIMTSNQFSVHPEIPDETLAVSDSERRHFSFWLGNRGIARRRTWVPPRGASRSAIEPAEASVATAEGSGQVGRRSHRPKAEKDFFEVFKRIRTETRQSFTVEARYPW